MAHPIQIILARQLAGYLGVPLFLIDPGGSLLFYNEAAEAVLGRRFDETGPMTAAEWSSIFAPMDEGGRPLAPDRAEAVRHAVEEALDATGPRP